MSTFQISDREFNQIQSMLFEQTGIKLTPAKKPLVVSRLSKRLTHFGLVQFTDYIKLLGDKGFINEKQTALNLLTTNETYFFRENRHFDFLRNLAQQTSAREPMRIWSAACSNGQEPYSIAMTMADALGRRDWQVLGSDISTRVLECAENAVYPVEQAQKIPEPMLKEYCLKGVNECEGTFRVAKNLRDRVSFRHLNLNETLPDIGMFDVVFLRNVMIYFEVATKQKVVERIASHIKPGGYLIISLSESLSGVSKQFKMLEPSIYQKPVA